MKEKIILFQLRQRFFVCLFFVKPILVIRITWGYNGRLCYLRRVMCPWWANPAQWVCSKEEGQCQATGQSDRKVCAILFEKDGEPSPMEPRLAYDKWDHVQDESRMQGPMEHDVLQEKLLEAVEMLFFPTKSSTHLSKRLAQLISDPSYSYSLGSSLWFNL